MIEIFLLALDKIKSLLEVRNKRLRQVYLELISPLFQDMLLIHSDYIKMFNDIGAILEDNSKPIDQRVREAVSQLRRRRLEFEAVRTQLRALLSELPGSDIDESVKNFIKAATEYFPDGAVHDIAPTAGSSMLRMLNYWNDALGIEVVDEELDSHCGQKITEVIDKTVEDQREGWAAVCSAFAIVKIKAAQTVGS